MVLSPDDSCLDAGERRAGGRPLSEDRRLVAMKSHERGHDEPHAHRAAVSAQKGALGGGAPVSGGWLDRRLVRSDRQRERPRGRSRAMDSDAPKSRRAAVTIRGFAPCVKQGAPNILFRMDRLTKERRSEVMSRIGPRDTAPELAVRRTLHALGYRYRLHSPKLPGKPDIVLSKYHTVVFVHGCFWHGHRCRKGQHRPTSNADFWNAKLDRNIVRDRATAGKLRKLGWRVVTVWECQVRKDDALPARLARLIASN
jgi:DNA mismatch endonuclease, patch repair protein